VLACAHSLYGNAASRIFGVIPRRPGLRRLPDIDALYKRSPRRPTEKREAQLHQIQACLRAVRTGQSSTTSGSASLAWRAALMLAQPIRGRRAEDVRWKSREPGPSVPPDGSRPQHSTRVACRAVRGRSRRWRRRLACRMSPSRPIVGPGWRLRLTTRSIAGAEKAEDTR